MRKTLLSTITDRAEASFKKPIADYFDDWQLHWIETARRWKSELDAEGLTQTADSVADHIYWGIKNYESRKVPSIKYYRNFTDFFDADLVDYKLGYDSKCLWFVPGTWKD